MLSQNQLNSKCQRCGEEEEVSSMAITVKIQFLTASGPKGLFVQRNNNLLMPQQKQHTTVVSTISLLHLHQPDILMHEQVLETLYPRQTSLHSPLGLFLRPAANVPLHLSLVYTVHGQPNKRTPDSEAPEAVASPRVKIKTVGKQQAVMLSATTFKTSAIIKTRLKTRTRTLLILHVSLNVIVRYLCV